MTERVVRSRRARTESPARLRTPYTVDACMPSSQAIRCGPAPSSRRRRQIASTTCSARACGVRRGRLERSRSPASPSALNRFHHLATVLRETPCASATWAWVQPARTRSTTSLRPENVSFPLAWDKREVLLLICWLLTANQLVGPLSVNNLRGNYS